MTTKALSREYICEDINTGKKYKKHKGDFIYCDCPDCYRGEHEMCVRCGEFI